MCKKKLWSKITKIKFVLKKLLVINTFLFLFLTVSPVHAGWNGNWYQPGETLDPECVPGDVDCGIDISAFKNNSPVEFSLDNNPWFIAKEDGDGNKYIVPASSKISLGSLAEPFKEIFVSADSVLVDGTRLNNANGLLKWGGHALTMTPTASNSAEIRLGELSGNGSNYVALKAPSAITSNLTLTLPATAGTNGQALATNGSGILSWSSILSPTLSSGQIFVGDASNLATGRTMSGDATISNTGALTISANAVALGTDTTGNYVAGNTAGTGITISGTAGEGWSPTIAVNQGATLVWTGVHTFANSSGISLNPYGASAGNTTGIFFKELVSNGTNVVGFKAPDSIAVNKIWTLPSIDGSNGQTLSTNGSGILSWLTPASSGITSFNGLTATSQIFATGATGTDFNIASSGGAHTFNIPSASATARGLVTTNTQIFAGDKTFANNLLVNGNVGIGTTSPSYHLELAGTNSIAARTIGVNGIPIAYLPDQSSFYGSLGIGNGLRSLSHSTGYQGQYNTAAGINVLLSATTGHNNTALGTSALYSNTTGYDNTALGVFSLSINITGYDNVAVGQDTLGSSSTSIENTAIGSEAGINLTGNKNILLGYSAASNLTTGNNNIVIGYKVNTPAANSSNTLNIGNLIFGTGINGTGSTLSSGNVGIGTASPSQKLYVGGGNIGLDGNRQIVFSDTDTSNNLKLQLWSGYGLGINGGTLFYAAGGTHSWRDSGGANERMSLSTAANGGLTVKGTGNSSFVGNVGIGAVSPGEKLDIAGNTRLLKTNTATATTQYASGDLKLQSSSWDTALNDGDGGESVNNFSLRSTGLSGSGATYRFGIFNNAGTELLSVRENGNVGIGTASPATKLDVAGSIRGNSGLTITAGAVSLPSGQIDNVELANSSFTVTSGTGLTGGGAVSLGGLTTVSAVTTGQGVSMQGNFGQWQAHSTYTDFNANPAHWGWNYVLGNTNAPNSTSAQWYRNVVSLGSQYPMRGAGGYSLELAFPRANQAAAGVWMRAIENGAIGGWTQIGFTNPMTAAGDLIYRNTGGTTRLGIGTAGQVLTVSGGVPVWASAAACPTCLINNGNSFGALATIGTNDNQALAFETNNTERLRITNAGNIGLGTASPGQKLEVAGNILAYDPSVLGDNIIVNGAMNPPYTSPGGTGRGVIAAGWSAYDNANGSEDSDSFVSDPSSQLVSPACCWVNKDIYQHVTLEPGEVYVFSFQGARGPYNDRYRAGVDGGLGEQTFILPASGWQQYTYTFTATSSNGRVWFSNPHGTYSMKIDDVSLRKVNGGNMIARGLFTGGGVTGIKITSSGNVAIGAVDPASKLDLAGDLRLRAQGSLRLADSDSSHYLAFQSPSTVANNIVWTLPAVDGSNGQVLTTNGAGALSWATPNISIPDATTTTRGLVSIGNQTFAGKKTFQDGLLSNGALEIITDDEPSLYVRKTSGVNPLAKFELDRDVGGTATYLLELRYNNGDSWEDDFYMTFEDGALGYNGSIRGDDGRGVWFFSASDMRVKDVLGIPNDALQKVMSIPVHSYKWKAGSEKPVTYGLLAQEVYEVYPEIVGVGSDELDENGNLANPWSLDYGKFTPVLLKSVQELNIKVDTLAATAPDMAKEVQETPDADQLVELIIEKIKNENALEIDRLLELKLDTLFFLEKNGALSFDNDIIFRGRLTYEDKDMAGYAKIKKGGKEVKVAYEKPYEFEPVVTATALDKEIMFILKERNKDGFTIEISDKAKESILFSWHAILVKEPFTAENESMAPSSTPESTITSASESTSSAQQGFLVTQSPIPEEYVPNAVDIE